MLHRRCIIDIESTGLSWQKGDRVIEVACVELEGLRITGRKYQQYINPGVRVHPDAQRIHGLSDAFLADKPPFQHIADDLMAFIGDAELIAHNAKFDIGFINSELSKLKCPLGPLANRVTDTVELSKLRRPGKRHSLDALAKDLKIKTTRTEGLHGALPDCMLLAQCYVHLLQTAGTIGMDLSIAEPARAVTWDLGAGQLIVLHPSADEMMSHERICKAMGIKVF